MLLVAKILIQTISQEVNLTEGRNLIHLTLGFRLGTFN